MCEICGIGGNERQFGKHSIGCTPHLHGVGVGIHDVLEMSGHGGAIDSWAGSWEADSLGDVEDYAGEAVFVEVDFLVIGHLTNCALLYG